MNAPDSTSYASAPPDEDAAPNEDAAPDEEAPDQTEAHRCLREAVPDDKPALVMDLIERHPEGRLVLPKQGERGAALAEVNLSTEALEPHLSAEHAADPPWWNDEQGALRLYGADLEGAVLRGADLRGALLENAPVGPRPRAFSHAPVRKSQTTGHLGPPGDRLFAGPPR